MHGEQQKKLVHEGCAGYKQQKKQQYCRVQINCLQHYQTQVLQHAARGERINAAAHVRFASYS